MRNARLRLGLSAALAVAGCGDGGGPEPPPPGDGGVEPPPPPIVITSMSPAAGAAAVETGATVTVVFDQAIDPATLTATTFLVKRGGVPLPVALSYDAATRTARAVAPLLPGVTYEAEVTTGVRTSGNAALGAPEVWSFTTRAWQAATVDAAGVVGLSTALAMDASGRLHVN